MSSARRRTDPADLVPYVGAGAVGLVFLLAGGTWVACALAHEIGKTPAPPNNPFALLIDLATGERAWPGTAATVVAGIELVLLAGAAQLIWLLRGRVQRGSVDAAQRHMASRSGLKRLGPRAAAATAKRLGTRASTPGVLVGRVVGHGQPLYGSWEDMHCDIWGPRTGKTTARAIPAICDAPGAAIVTSNKRDVVDATRGVRAARGRAWLYDPQGLLDDEQTFYWDPTSYVVDVDRAERLAALWSDYARAPDAKRDAYFDPEGEALLAYMLLAAAYDGPITTVYRWLADPTDTRPVDVLRDAGHDLPAAGVQGVINLPEKQRGGIYGTALKAVRFLANPKTARWVIPQPDLPAFNPAEFVASTDTMYSISQEGRANVGPIVAGLNVANIEAAEELATRSPGGRLRVPFLGVLDEAANTVRWRGLPDLYSHYGSRGIILMTILQNWSQGVLAWGEAGMEKLWSSANIRVYGGGDVNVKFLGGLSELIGPYEPTTTSLSVQRGQNTSRSTTTSTREEKILDVADLSAMERGRAIVFPSGSRPALIQTQPWTAGPYADAIRASLAQYAPSEEMEQHLKDAEMDRGTP